MPSAYKVRYARVVILEKDFECDGGLEDAEKKARQMERTAHSPSVPSRLARTLKRMASRLTKCRTMTRFGR